MVAPDPGLEGAIGAVLESYFDDFGSYDLPDPYRLATLVMPVVEQHTNRRIAEANTRAKARVKSANKRASIRITQIRREESARFEAEVRAEKAEANALAWSETYRGAINVRDDWRARAEKAEATIARVWALIPRYSAESGGRATAEQIGWLKGVQHVQAQLRAALKGG